MTVVIASLLRAGDSTGVNTHFEGFAEYLRDSGRPVTVVSPFDEPKWLVYPAFAVRRIIEHFSGPASVWWYRYWHYYFLRRALKKLLRLTPDAIVYAQCPLSARAAREARRDSSQRVFLAVHFNVSQADEWVGKGVLTDGHRLYESIRRHEAEILPALDGLVFVSDFVRGKLSERIPAINDVRSAVIPNCVNEPEVRAGDREPVADLITIGTLEPRKNQAYALAVLAAAMRMGHRFTLTLVGDGPDRGALEKLAKQLGISEQVRFAGRVSGASSLMSEHRAYIHTAHLESCPFVILEALACGLPVFSAPEGGIPELFTNGVEGCYLPLDDPDKAASHLVGVLDMEDRYKAMAAASFKRFDRDYRATVVAEKLYSFLVTRQP